MLPLIKDKPYKWCVIEAEHQVRVGPEFRSSPTLLRQSQRGAARLTKHLDRAIEVIVIVLLHFFMLFCGLRL